MKKLLIFTLIIFIGACQAQQSSEEETTQEEAALVSYSSYGDEITADDPVTPDQMLKDLEGADSIEVKLEASILKTCKMKGCWMDVDMGNGEVMKVTFKDYGFFVPKEGMEGKEVVMQGVVSREMVDVETLQHYAEDAGEDEETIAAITEPEERLAFVATGVLIKD